MTVLTFAQLEGVWIQAGGDPAKAPLMAAIALAESSGDPEATNPTDNNGTQTSWGLWQISNGDHSEPSSDWNTPLGNARLAVGKIESQGLGAWGTYTSGAYRQYLQSGTAPDTSGSYGGGGGATGGGFAGGGSAGRPGVSQADLLSTLGPWLGPLLGTVTGGGAGGEALGLPSILGTVFGPIANAFTDFAHALSVGMTAVLWLVNPRNWLRIIAGIVGAVSVTAGAVMLARAS